MATNSYFDNFTNVNEQTLHADLIEEAIYNFGTDIYYLPRTQRNFDDLYNQDDMSAFNSAYLVEMYIKSVDSFEGEGSFLSHFGLEVRDRVTLSVSRRRFDTEVGTHINSSRPREGDLLFFPMTNKLFEIMYTDTRAQFFPLGALPLHDLQAEVFEYNGEVFNTGVAAIDAIAANLTIDRLTDPVDANNDSVPDLDLSGGPLANFSEPDRDVEFDNTFIDSNAPTVDISGFSQ